MDLLFPCLNVLTLTDQLNAISGFAGRFECWDLGGQESLRGTWSSYFLDTDGVILVVDSTDRERTAIVREELGKLLTNEQLKQACILVFANKQDLREAMTAAEIPRNEAADM